MNRQHARLIDRIEASGKEFLDSLGKIDPVQLNAPLAVGEWSIHAIAAHMRDNEEHVFYPRIRRILSADEPPVVENFDQDKWILEHYDPGEPLKKISADLRAARRKEVQLLRKMKDKDWSRFAIHPEYGMISVEFIATHNYAHTLEHLHQLLELQEKNLLRELNG